jgi:hypothetical protein
MGDVGALEQDRTMIAAKADPRHPRGERRDRGGASRQPLRRSAGSDAREVGRPRDERVERLREPGLSPVLAARLDARDQRDRRLSILQFHQ